MTTPKKKSEPKLDGLAGRCFVVWGDDDEWNLQGIVRARLDDERYLVQFFDAIMGEPSTMAIYHISQMTLPTEGYRRAKGNFEFFEDDEHLRFWAEYVRGKRDINESVG